MRGIFRRGPALEARGKLGKRERVLSRTSGCPWFAGRRSEAAAPQAPTDSDGTARRGGASAAMGGGGWAWELRWGEVKPFPRSVGAEGGRRWELDEEVGAAAALLTGGGVPAWLGDGEWAWEDQ